MVRGESLRTPGHPAGHFRTRHGNSRRTSPIAKGGWGVVITYEEDGYVKDDDASKINYGELLAEMQKEASEANEARKKEGYPAVEIVGWAAPPRYDESAKKRYWAKELKFGDSSENTLNYNIRALGRRGVLVLNAVAGKSQLGIVEQQMPQGRVVEGVDRSVDRGQEAHPDRRAGADRNREVALGASPP